MVDSQVLNILGKSVKAAVDTGLTSEDRAGLWPTVGEYPVYDTPWYQTLTSDHTRNERFRAALQQLAPGRTVLDIGTGEHLNWARESLQCGARHALAVEEIPSTFRRASGNMRAWALEQDITLLQGRSSEVEISPKADVCVAEVIGSVAGAEGAAAVLADARRRHLTSDGVVIPHRCATQAAAVSLRDALGRRPAAFSLAALPYLSKIFESNGAPFDVRLRIHAPERNCVLSTAHPIELLEFNGDLRTEQENRVALRILRPGHVDGILTWLHIACLSHEEPIDTLRDATSWGTIYFPLFPEEVPVKPGDRMELTVRTTLSDDGVHPDYYFAATLYSAGNKQSATHSSLHHGGPFRAHPLYQTLFPQ